MLPERENRRGRERGAMRRRVSRGGLERAAYARETTRRLLSVAVPRRALWLAAVELRGRGEGRGGGRDSGRGGRGQQRAAEHEG